MTYREAVDWLYGQQMHGIRLGLENMQQLATALNLPLDSAVPGAPLYFHVAGTNGKGSVCALLDSILRAGGVRTGLYTSPHLVTFRERIRLDGAMISAEAVAEGLTVIRDVIETWNPRPTFFEITTALALRWFAAQGAEAVVLETGLGGRLDATNVTRPAVSVLTPIGYDHQAYLGNTLGEIAGEKAGILKPGIPVVSSPQPIEAATVIATLAAKRESPLDVPQDPWTQSPIGLVGAHQGWNAAVACLALEVAGAQYPRLRLSPEIVARGLAEVQWPGRFQEIDGRFVLDGAHNPAAARQLAATWREQFGDTPTTLILGVMRDKDHRGVAEALAPLASRVFTVQVNNARTCTAEELAAEVRALDPAKPCTACGSLQEALAQLSPAETRILIAGSLFLVGEALVALGEVPGEGETSNQ